MTEYSTPAPQRVEDHNVSYNKISVNNDHKNTRREHQNQIKHRPPQLIWLNRPQPLTKVKVRFAERKLVYWVVKKGTQGTLVNISHARPGFLHNKIPTKGVAQGDVMCPLSLIRNLSSSGEAAASQEVFNDFDKEFDGNDNIKCGGESQVVDERKEWGLWKDCSGFVYEKDRKMVGEISSSSSSSFWRWDFIMWKCHHLQYLHPCLVHL